MLAFKQSQNAFVDLIMKCTFHYETQVVAWCAPETFTRTVVVNLHVLSTAQLR